MARILIIDDDRAVSTAIKLVLERSAHDVVVANDGRKGFDLFQASHFDLLIVDIFMPGMDGFETMTSVRRHRPETPVIVISGHMIQSERLNTPDFLGMATKLGAVSSLQKPFKPRDLLAAIDNCLSRSPSPLTPDPSRRDVP